MLSRTQLPPEFIGMDSHDKACHVKIIYFHLCKEISAVYETCPNHFARMFIRILPLERQKGVELMAAASPEAVNALDSICQGPYMYVPLPRPCSCQFYHLIILVRQI